MAYPAEATIAREMMKFAENGLLYRGSKPVMWSVVEKTALAEAEVEYQDYQSDMIWVKFPVYVGLDPINVAGTNHDGYTQELNSASVLIWTTTPWTIPGNRAISFSSKISYGLYRVTEAPEGNWAKVGETYIVANKLAGDVKERAKITHWEHLRDVNPDGFSCTHPLRALGYTFPVPLLDGDHVTDDTGTGFVHTAPGHGADDYNIWIANNRRHCAIAGSRPTYLSPSMPMAC